MTSQEKNAKQSKNANADETIDINDEIEKIIADAGEEIVDEPEAELEEDSEKELDDKTLETGDASDDTDDDDDDLDEEDYSYGLSEETAEKINEFVTNLEPDFSSFEKNEGWEVPEAKILANEKAYKCIPISPKPLTTSGLYRESDKTRAIVFAGVANRKTISGGYSADIDTAYLKRRGLVPEHYGFNLGKYESVTVSISREGGVGRYSKPYRPGGSYRLTCELPVKVRGKRYYITMYGDVLEGKHDVILFLDGYIPSRSDGIPGSDIIEVFGGSRKIKKIGGLQFNPGAHYRVLHYWMAFRRFFLEAYVSAITRGKRIWLVGYSAGGAASVLAAYDFTRNERLRRPEGIFSFGAIKPWVQLRTRNHGINYHRRFYFAADPAADHHMGVLRKHDVKPYKIFKKTKVGKKKIKTPGGSLWKATRNAKRRYNRTGWRHLMYTYYLSLYEVS